MPAKSAAAKVLDALEDLKDGDFKKFIFQLQNLKELKIHASDVEGKKRIDITELLVSRCTEARVVDTTIKILKAIGCNNEAEKLGPRQKALSKKKPPSSNEPGPSSKPHNNRANKKQAPKKKKVNVKEEGTKTQTTLMKNKKKSPRSNGPSPSAKLNNPGTIKVSKRPPTVKKVAPKAKKLPKSAKLSSSKTSSQPAAKKHRI